MRASIVNFLLLLVASNFSFEIQVFVYFEIAYAFLLIRILFYTAEYIFLVFSFGYSIIYQVVWKVRMSELVLALRFIINYTGWGLLTIKMKVPRISFVSALGLAVLHFNALLRCVSPRTPVATSPSTYLFIFSIFTFHVSQDTSFSSNHTSLELTIKEHLLI